MKKIFYILCLIFFSFPGFSQDFTRDDAFRLVLHKIIVPATLDHNVMAFMTKTPLVPGDVISPAVEGKEKRIQKPTWFAWINDHAESLFEHRTRFVYIDANTGKYTISHENWWPMLNGTNLFMSDEERTDLELIIYSDFHVNIPDQK